MDGRQCFRPRPDREHGTGQPLVGYLDPTAKGHQRAVLASNPYPDELAALDPLGGRQGVPFREAHAIVGRVVTWASDKKISLEELNLNEWLRFSPKFKPTILQNVKIAKTIKNKISWGGTSGLQVKKAIARAKKRLFQKK